jgi:predicted transcriptional regulator
MHTVVLEVRSLADTLADAARAMKSGRGDAQARIAFASPELLWQVLSAKRWELLKAMCGAGPMSIREAARRVKRDVKAVHGDVTARLDAGVLCRSPEGQVAFPFGSVRVQFLSVQRTHGSASHA